jgi:DnaD/phage-associated family protein
LVPLPADFVEHVLPHISNIVELKVTLHVFAMVTRQSVRPRRVSWDMLCDDATLNASLQVTAVHARPRDLLAEGLSAAVQRGTLMHVVRTDAHGRAVNWYLVRTDANLAWAARHEGVLDGELHTKPQHVVAVYEQHIGVVSPMILAEIQQAQRRYPDAWIIDAIHEAVVANAHAWRYVAKILARWGRDGRHGVTPDAAGIDANRYTDGTYGDLFRRGSDTSDLDSMP